MSRLICRKRRFLQPITPLDEPLPIDCPDGSPLPSPASDAGFEFGMEKPTSAASEAPPQWTEALTGVNGCLHRTKSPSPLPPPDFILFEYPCPFRVVPMSPLVLSNLVYFLIYLPFWPRVCVQFCGFLLITRSLDYAAFQLGRWRVSPFSPLFVPHRCKLSVVCAFHCF